MASFNQLIYCLLGFDSKPVMDITAYNAPFGIKDEHSKKETLGSEVLIKPIEENLPKTILRLGTSPHSLKYSFKCVVYRTPPVFQKEFSAMRFKTALFSYLLPPGSRQFQYVPEDLYNPKTVATLSEFHGLLSFQRDLKEKQQVHFETEREDGESISFSIGVGTVETHETFELECDILDAAFQRLASFGLAQEEMQTSVFFEKPRLFQFFQLVDRDFKEPQVIDFRPDEKLVKNSNTALFSLAIPFVKKTALFFSAFYGKNLKGGDEKCRFEYNRTELLDCLVLSDADRVKSTALEHSKVLKDKLEMKGFIVQL